MYKCHICKIHQWLGKYSLGIIWICSSRKTQDISMTNSSNGGCPIVIELDDGKIYRKTLYLMVKTMVSCKFSLKPIQ
jgi:hypothetical protein